MGDKQGMSFTPRSGDTHVIGEDGEAVNVDAQVRVGASTDKSDAQPPQGSASDPTPQPTDAPAGGRKSK